MKTDKLVYLLLQLLPQAFFALIGRAVEDAENYVFKSVEVKEKSFRIDGVFIPKLLGDFIYFVEAQFQRDEQFYARFFAEIFLYLKQYGATHWRAVVIYPSRSAEQKNSDGYRELIESDRVQRIYLDELPDQSGTTNDLDFFKLLIEPEATAPTVAKRLLENATLKQVDLIEQIIAYKFTQLNREEIKQMLGIQEELLKDTQFYKDILAEGLEKGKQEGLEKGKQEGEVTGKLAAVPLLRKLGMLDEQIADNLQLPLELVKSAK